MKIKNAIFEAAKSGEIDEVTKDLMLACLEDTDSDMTNDDSSSVMEDAEPEESVEEKADAMRCRIYEAEMSGSITAEERVELLQKVDDKLAGM